MSEKPRYLSKSRHKTAMECPTKLFYGSHKEYGNKKVEDSFLISLAKGGFQVGELAKLYHPGGHNIETLDYEESVQRTNDLLKQDNVTIYEAAFRYKDLFVRVDILKKIGNSIELIEVKSKSYEATDTPPYRCKREFKKGLVKIQETWKPYIYDVTFQTYVLKSALPELTIIPYLYLLNKSSVATVDGLNQKFFLAEVKGRTCVRVQNGFSPKDVGDKLLVRVNLEEEVNAILAGNDQGKDSRKNLGLDSFEEDIWSFVEVYKNDKKFPPALSKTCKSCEFRIGDDLKAKGLKSGFEECWTKTLGVSTRDLQDPFVFDIWDFRGASTCIEKEGRYFARELGENDIHPIERNDGLTGMSRTERQWLQVKWAVDKQNKPEIRLEELSKEIQSWQFPYHFIDFETTRVAIPFNKGRRPYEQIAFQFSHHLVHENGEIEHKGEWINTERGQFPNYEFVRALKAQLDKDEGTIFRYSNHENTVLVEIHSQLQAEPDNKVADRDQLCQWIETITKKKDGDSKVVVWEGRRNMVDLLEIVKRFYWTPQMGGSNSIKQVLPAVLSDSKYLQEKYSKPIYGNGKTITSMNFPNHTWVLWDESGRIKDPYKTLEPVHARIDSDAIDNSEWLVDPELADGGAAMMAYAMMQFTETTEAEAEAIRKALLRYCELDTFAMVMIYEYWREAVRKFEQEQDAA